MQGLHMEIRVHTHLTIRRLYLLFCTLIWQAPTYLMFCMHASMSSVLSISAPDEAVRPKLQSCSDKLFGHWSDFRGQIDLQLASESKRGYTVSPNSRYSLRIVRWVWTLISITICWQRSSYSGLHIPWSPLALPDRFSRERCGLGTRLVVLN